ncbi:MAG TPA: hypothetical protein DEP69_05645 [Acidimicrobiaceae bacterium]|nr:hypothetical protein [Acidimicrobiaceae bacterium]
MASRLRALLRRRRDAPGEHGASGPPGALGPPRPTDGEPATAADVTAAYRLLLGREPDQAGLDMWVGSGHNPRHLAMALMDSVEFQNTRRPAADADKLELLALDGFRMWVSLDDWNVGTTIARNGTWEPRATAAIAHLLRPGDTFVDIGANVGWHALNAALAVGESGAVYAFEPSRDNCGLLLASIAENGFANVELRAMALGDRRGVLALYSGAGGSNGTTQRYDAAELGLARRHIVAASTLDAELADVEQVDVVKIDVEGSEAAVLAGGVATLRRRRPHLVLEFTPDEIEARTGEPAERFLAEIAGLGYRIGVLDPADGAPVEPGTALDGVRFTRDPARVLADHAASGRFYSDLVCLADGRDQRAAAGQTTRLSRTSAGTVGPIPPASTRNPSMPP